MSVFGLEKETVVEGWRKWPSKELHNLYSSPNDVRMIKSRRIKWGRRVACMGQKKRNFVFRKI
jgi:hypothetical protein